MPGYHSTKATLEYQKTESLMYLKTYTDVATDNSKYFPYIKLMTTLISSIKFVEKFKHTLNII